MDSKSEEDIFLSMDELKESLINHVCSEKRAFFRHQQKNEDEIEMDEKKSIVKDLLDSSHSKFLSRFGTLMKKDHLRYFETQNELNKNDFISEQIKNLKFFLDHEKRVVKNRRYAAMIKLIQDKEYFSDYEMEKRNPVMYNELVGRFISPVERAASKRRQIAENNTLVDVLLDQIDHDVQCENMKKQEDAYEDDDDSNESSNDPQTDTETSSQYQWGNFDDQQVKVSNRSEKSRKRRNANLLITASERDILRDEFLGIMYNNFLMGLDADYYDYSQVDNNQEYDETLENDQDCEDKYFDDEDSHESLEVKKQETIADESDDELDIYMKHIENHIKKQQQSQCQEEFDD